MDAARGGVAKRRRGQESTRKVCSGDSEAMGGSHIIRGEGGGGTNGVHERPALPEKKETEDMGTLEGRKEGSLRKK